MAAESIPKLKRQLFRFLLLLLSYSKASNVQKLWKREFLTFSSRTATTLAPWFPRELMTTEATLAIDHLRDHYGYVY